MPAMPADNRIQLKAQIPTHGVILTMIIFLRRLSQAASLASLQHNLRSTYDILTRLILDIDSRT